MDLEKGVSVALSFNRTVIDELQYIGNLKVDFDYSQECYVIKGTWYQVLPILAQLILSINKLCFLGKK